MAQWLRLKPTASDQIPIISFVFELPQGLPWSRREAEKGLAEVWLMQASSTFSSPCLFLKKCFLGFGEGPKWFEMKKPVFLLNFLGWFYICVCSYLLKSSSPLMAVPARRLLRTVSRLLHLGTWSFGCQSSSQLRDSVVHQLPVPRFRHSGSGCLFSFKASNGKSFSNTCNWRN